MVELKIIEEHPITLAELKEEFKTIKERDTELGFRTAKVAEQLETVKIIKYKDAQELYKKIDKLAIPRLKNVHITKIVDLMPTNMLELKNIIQGYSLTVTNENLQKILDTVQDYSEKKKS